MENIGKVLTELTNTYKEEGSVQRYFNEEEYKDVVKFVKEKADYYLPVTMLDRNRKGLAFRMNTNSPVFFLRESVTHPGKISTGRTVLIDND